MLAEWEYTDQELIRLLSEGNKHAFDCIYNKYWDVLYKKAFSVLKDQKASQDIIQDIFVWIWANRGRLEVKNLKSYLSAAVKFKIANLIRSGNVRRGFLDELAGCTIQRTTISSDELAELRELNHIIQYTVSRLPVKCRLIFTLSRENHLSNKEIADQLSLSIKTVENQMTIAIRKIRTALEPYLVLLLVGAFCLCK